MKRITIVLAEWCPHCVPLSLEKSKEMTKALEVPLCVLDIDDSEQEKLADELVLEHGDFTEDYLIPQVFAEYDDAAVKHIFTGFSEAVDVTKARWDDFFASEFYGRKLVPN